MKSPRAAGLGRPAVLLLVALLAWSCGDDAPTGPQFGDLAITALDNDLVYTFEMAGDRDTTVAVRNTSDVTLGPIVLSAAPATRQVGPPVVICSSLVTVISPSRLASLAPGETAEIEVSFDDSAVTPDECPTSVGSLYAVDVTAAVDNRALATATFILDLTL